jgi:hypothetical protein
MQRRINAQQSGNWSNPNTWFGGIFPSKEDAVYCNGCTITVDIDIEVKSITNQQTYFDISGGNLIVLDDVKITSHLIGGSEPLIKLNGEDLYVLGIIEGSRTMGYIPCIENNGTGTIYVSGNVRGGWGGFTNGIINNSTGTIDISGSLNLGWGGGSCAILNNNNGRIIVNGIESTENGCHGTEPYVENNY